MVERSVTGKVYIDSTEIGTVSGTYIDEVGTTTGSVSPVDLSYMMQIFLQILPFIMLILFITILVAVIK